MADGLVFGIFPGLSGAEYSPLGGSPERYDADRTLAALRALQPPGAPFVVRAYGVYHGAGRVAHVTPPGFLHLLGEGRTLEYVLVYRSTEGDVSDWVGVVRRTVAELGTGLSAIQVAEEPNNPDPAAGDGASPRVMEAVVEGVRAADEERGARGLAFAVGINATPSFNPADRYWPSLVDRGGPAFVSALDYVGLDFFPDVFRPLPTPDFRSAVEGVIGHFRGTLSAAGIAASVPIRITENGWPTGEGRPPERQAEVLEAVVRAVHHARLASNVTYYELFALRDSLAGPESGLTEWGLLRADYSPKPAFETYRRLVAEHGARAV
jgi:hypothetical protein